MFCSNCGIKLPDDARFCSGCGSQISPAAIQAVAQMRQPAPVQAAEPIQQPAPAQAVEPAPVQAAEPIQQPAPAQAAEPIQQPAPVQAAAPVQQPAPAQAAEPVQQPAPVQAAEPIQQPAPVQAAEPVQQPAPAQAAGPVQQPAPVQAVEPAPVQTAEPIQQPAPVQAANFSEFAVPAAPEAPKKKKKKTGAIIAAASAVVVLGGGAAAGYFCFSNQISRAIKSDAGFAADLEKKTMGFFAGGETDNSESDKLISSIISSSASTAKSFGTASDQHTDLASEEWDMNSASSIGANYASDIMSDAAASIIPYIKEMIEKSDNTEFRSGISLDIGGSLGKLLGEYSGTVSDIADVLNKSSIAVRTVHGDNCEVLEISPELNGKPLLDLDVFTDWKNIVISAPKITDYYFAAEIPPELLESAGLPVNADSPAVFSADELRRLLDGLTQIYYDSFKNAKITFTDGTFTVAGKEISATKVSAVFTAEQIIDIRDKMLDYLKNDEYLRNFFTEATGMDISEYEKAFSEITTEEYEEGEEWLEVCSYIGAHEKLLAKEYRSPSNDDCIAFLRNDSETRFVIYTANGMELSVVDQTTGENSGTVEFSFKEDKDSPALVIELVYMDAKMSEYKGMPVPTGSFTLKLSDKDELIDSKIPDSTASGTSSASKITDLMSVSTPDMSDINVKQIIKDLSVTLKISQSGDKSDLRADFILNITDYIGLSTYFEMKPYSGQAPAMPAAGGDKCLKIDEDVSQAVSNELMNDLIKNVTRIVDENKEIEEIAGKFGVSIRDALEQAAAEAEKNNEIYRHYSDYKEYSSGWEAEDAAADLFDAYETQFMDWGYSAGEEEIEKYGALVEKLLEEPMTVKVYYDKDGKATVIDDCGFDFIDFDQLGEYNSYCRKAYCEIVIDPTNASPTSELLLTGVCVVYTDDPSDLPSGLPDTYNYIDKLYEWESNDNTSIKNGFVIGTAPKLYYGVSTAKERIEEEKKQALKAAAEFDADLSKLNTYAHMLAGACNQFLPNMLSGPEDSSMSYTGSDEYSNYYDDHEFLWNTYSVAVSFTDGKWKIDDILLGNSSGISPEQITDGELFASGGKFEDYLNSAAAHMTSGEEIKAEIIIWNGEFAGLITAYADSGIDFTEYNVPGEYDIVLGYFMDWSRYSSYNDAVAGKYYLDYDRYVPIGSWCSCTEAPLTVYPPSGGGYSDEALNDIAGLIYEKTAPYFEDKGKLISSDSTYAVSILHTNYSDLSDWYVIMISDGDRDIESMDEEKMEEFSNFLNDERELDEAVNIYAMLYFCDGEPVGVLAMDADDTWMIDDYDQLPLAEEMAEGVYEPKGVNAAFGTWCIANEGPIFNYYQY